MAVKKKIAVKKKAVKKAAKPRAVVKKKKPSGKTTGAVNPKNTRRKRNKNNLTDEEQKFADLVLTNENGETATDLVLKVLPKISRASARVKASNWMNDERIRAYQDMMRERVEDQTEYDMVKWRRDVLELIDIAMGRKGKPKALPVKVDEKTKIEDIKVNYIDIREFEGSTAKAALELIAKQMKLLTDKTELGLNEMLLELFGKVKPTLGPPSLRDKPDERD